MSTFTLPSSKPACKVHLPPDTVSQDELLNFPAFKTWISALQKSLALQHSDEKHAFHKTPYVLRSIKVQSVDRFGGDRLGFIKLQAEVSNDDDEKLPGSVLLRGGSVGMLLILQPDDVPASSQKDKHAILTLQPRIPGGSLAFAELPAGMLDDAGSFGGGAAKEIKEETGLELEEKDLTDMTALAMGPGNSAGEQLQRGVYTSPGGQDEFVPLFVHERRVKRDTLGEWTGKLTGLREHGEKITLKLVRLEDLWREGARDAKTLAAVALYDGLKREGKL